VDSLEYLQQQMVPEMDEETERMLVCSFGNPMSEEHVRYGALFILAMLLKES